jgi:hypothetical protein
MLRVTLLRPLHTRGRGSLSEPVCQQTLLETAARIQKIFTGDIRVPVCSFLDDFAECSIIEVVESMGLLVNERVDSLGASPPSTNKWWTLEPSLVGQGTLAILHDILRRGVYRTFRSAAIVEPVDDNVEEDFHTRMNRKEAKCKEDAAGPQLGLAIIQALWAAEPVDKLNQSIQHEDFQSRAAFDLTHPRGLIYECQLRYFTMITSDPQDPAPLTSIVHHYNHPDSGHDPFEVQFSTCALCSIRGTSGSGEYEIHKLYIPSIYIVYDIYIHIYNIYTHACSFMAVSIKCRLLCRHLL